MAQEYNGPLLEDVHVASKMRDIELIASSDAQIHFL